MTYNYFEAVKNDLFEVLDNDIETYRDSLCGRNEDEAKLFLYEYCSTLDDITGNMSGSYTCNRWEAEENLLHNSDDIWNAIELGYVEDKLYQEAEVIDVGVRMYMLDEVIALRWSEILDRLGLAADEEGLIQDYEEIVKNA